MTESLKALARLLQAESGDSRALARNPEENGICSISIDHAVPCIKVVWKRYATSTQLRYVHEWLLVILKQHQLCKVLGDDTELPTIHSHDQLWITENWLPRARAAGLRTAASKRPASHLALLAIEKVQSAKASGILFGSFADVDSARNWLCSQ